jgi:hypothetical protein
MGQNKKGDMENIHLTEQTPSVLTDSGKVKDPGTVTNIFSIFFLAITESLNLHQVRREDVSFSKDTFTVKFPVIKII